MKKKSVLSVFFVISLLPMLLNQYGGRKGVQEITGLINLLNPIGIIAVAMFLIGVWVPFKKEIVGKKVQVGGQDYAITLVNVGNPHCVVFSDKVDD